MACITWCSCGPLSSSNDDALGCVVSLAAGLPAPRFTEIMLRPARAGGGSQWLELHNPGTQPFCLQGMHLGVLRQQGWRDPPIPTDQSMGPDAVWLVGEATGAQAALPLVGGPLPWAAGAVRLSCAGLVVAELQWGPDSPLGQPVVGRSAALDPWDVANGGPWCHVLGVPYDGFNVGTPGAVNQGCITCRDQVDGQMRAARLAAPGSLQIGAAHTDPLGPDLGHEWLQLRAHAPVDLVGLTLVGEVGSRAARRWHFVSATCAPLAQYDSPLLPVASIDAVPDAVGLWSGPTLPNADMVLSLWQFGRQLDRVLVPRARSHRPALPVQHLLGSQRHEG